MDLFELHGKYNHKLSDLLLIFAHSSICYEENRAGRSENPI